MSRAGKSREALTMSDTDEFASFDEFFPYYCGEHSRPLTRWMHFVGMHAAGAAVATAVVRRSPALLLAAPAVAFGTALVSHATVERRAPAGLDHPIWSLRADLVMIGMMWKGRDAEIQTMADRARLRRPIVVQPAPPETAPAA
jgi:hypothetical protein